MQTMWKYILCLICVGMTGAIRPICTPPATSQAKVARPTLPAVFEVHIECNFLDMNTSTEVHEFFDSTNNRGEVRQRDFGIAFWAYSSYKTNELIEVLPDTKECVVMNLQKNSQEYLFGYSKHLGKPGHIYSAYGALHFGEQNTVEVYQGLDTVRGIKVEKWYSCLYWQDMQATMNVTWYFSDPMNWDTALGIVSTPVRAHVVGRRTNKGSTYDFEHYYEFMHFKPYIADPTVFETPSGISCPGRQNTKPLPSIAPAYSFIVEIVDNVRSQISFMKEYYDQMMKMTKFTYKPSHLIASPYGYNPLTEIHDFNTGGISMTPRATPAEPNVLSPIKAAKLDRPMCRGPTKRSYSSCVAYIIDPMIGNCSYKAIEHGTFDDTSAKNPHLVRMRTSKQFFSLDGQGITYEGTKTTRNIDCDVWIGKRNTFQGFNYNSTWQWYFKQNSWIAAQAMEATYNNGTPIMYTIDVPDLSMSYTYNVYNYLQARPNMLNFDISPCFMELKRRKFDFRIPSEARDLVDRDRELFRYSVLMSLTYYTAVFPLRIANLKVVYDDHVHVRFEILDVRPVPGDVTMNTTETSLDVAAQQFMSKVNSNQFVIYVMQPGVGLPDTPYIVALPNSIREYTYESELAEDTGYSPGALGGLSAGMVVLGGVLGAGVSYGFFK